MATQPEVNWQERTEKECGSGAYVKVYEDSFRNYQLAQLKMKQAQLRKLAMEFLPFLVPWYYTEDKVKSYLNNPLDLIFHMEVNWITIRPLYYFLNRNAAEEELKLRYEQRKELYQGLLKTHLEKNADLQQRLNILQAEVDSLSMQLAQHLKKIIESTTNFHSGSNDAINAQIRDLADEDLKKEQAEELWNVLNLHGMQDRRLIITQEYVFFNTGSFPEGEVSKLVKYPHDYYWNNTVELPDFDVPKEFDRALIYCHFDPVVYSPGAFREFCDKYGLTTIAADWLFGLTKKVDGFYDFQLNEAQARAERKELTLIQLESKLGNFKEYLRDINHRKERIHSALNRIDY